MCEDQAHRRVNLNSILEACESQHKASILPSPAKVIRQLVEEVFHESVSLDMSLDMSLSAFSASLQAIMYVSEFKGEIIHGNHNGNK